MGAPVFIENSQLTTLSRLVEVGPVAIPGIGTGAAYAAGEQMGRLARVRVPKRGVILECKFHDLDDEGLGKEVWFFLSPSITLAADNDAFSLAPADITKARMVFDNFTFFDAVNCQIGASARAPAYYETRNGLLYFAVKTLGADNIAAGAIPQVSLIIGEYV